MDDLRRPVADTTGCEREPIHIPGAIQPHGFLLALAEPGLEVVAASVNAAPFFRLSAGELVGARYETLASEPGATRLRESLARLGVPGAATTTIDPGFPSREGEPAMLVTVHRHGGLVFVEAEPDLDSGAADARWGVPQLTAATKRLQEARSIEEASAILATEVRRLTGYDRVKIYRFADDWSGEVVAEDAAPAMPSYLGLHFPASDIPAQARALYRRNPIRIIPDIEYLPSALLPGRHPGTGAPIDLSFAVLRSVSPVHLEYLRNMGVRSSMSVSVLHEGELWGLIACHHAEPLLLSHGARHACELLAQLFSWQIGVIGDIAAHAHRRDVTALAGRIVDAMVAQPGHGEAGLVQHAPALLTLMAADGLAFIAGGRVTLYGETPTRRPCATSYAG